MEQEALAGTKSSRTEKLLLMLSLALCSFLTNLLNVAFGPFLPAMALELGVSVAVAGQVPAIMSLLASALALIAGPIADYFGYRRILLLSLVSMTLCALCVSLATSFVFLTVAVLFGAFSRATISPVAQAVAGESFVDAEQRRALSWMTAGISGVFVIGVPVLTSIAVFFGWQGAFIGLALIAAANLAMVTRTVPAGKPQTSKGVGLNIRSVLAGYREVLVHRPTLGLIAGFALSITGWYSILTYLGAFLVQFHGFDVQQVGFVYIAFGVGAMVGSVATGGRLGARPLRPLLIACRLCIIPLVGLSFLLPLPATAVAILLTLVIFLMAVCNVCTISLLTGETHKGRATTMALNVFVGTLGIGIGTAIGGLLLSVSGYPALGLASIALIGASVIVVWWSRPGMIPIPPGTLVG